ncbi:TPA: type II toxin-antitoxin system HicA family toxin [Escherichia coli]|uniref:type II toxin-antitoxin system HicA family toxin n=1 Tax=Escherichia coli TaxID=562 RepID=UPI0030A92224
MPCATIISCISIGDGSLGYVKKEMQGSRVRFFNAEINHTILMHRPHPESYIKGGTLKAIKQNLKEAGLL